VFAIFGQLGLDMNCAHRLADSKRCAESVPQEQGNLTNMLIQHLEDHFT
jgi:hypothetical protein